MKIVRNKQICVIGGGRWGENHIRTLYEMENLGAVVDMNTVRLKELKDKYGMATYTDLDDALRYGYDGYVVSTSAETHYEIGKKRRMLCFVHDAENGLLSFLLQIIIQKTLLL